MLSWYYRMLPYMILQIVALSSCERIQMNGKLFVRPFPELLIEVPNEVKFRLAV